MLEDPDTFNRLLGETIEELRRDEASSERAGLD